MQFLKYTILSVVALGCMIAFALSTMRPPTVVYKSVGPNLILCMDDSGRQTFFASHVWVEDQIGKWQVEYPTGKKIIVTGKCAVRDIESR